MSLPSKVVDYVTGLNDAEIGRMLHACLHRLYELDEIGYREPDWDYENPDGSATVYWKSCGEPLVDS